MSVHWKANEKVRIGEFPENGVKMIPMEVFKRVQMIMVTKHAIRREIKVLFLS